MVSAGEGSGLAQVLTVLLALAVVLGAVFLTYALARYLSAKGGFMSGRHMKILDRVSVGKDKYLLIVSLSGKVYFIGVAETISVLETWTDGFAEAEAQPEMPFAAILRGLRSGRRGQAGKESERTDA